MVSALSHSISRVVVWVIAFVTVAAGALAGCATDPVAAACVSNQECPSGHVCLGSGCRQVCIADPDCGANLACLAGACEPCAGCRRPPDIARVDGTGASSTDPAEAPHRLRGTIVLEGSNLDGVAVTLESPGQSTIPLTLCGVAIPERVEAALPENIAVGTYSLRVTNQAGSCATDLTLLRGEAGPPGSYTFSTGLSVTGTTVQVSESEIDGMVANNGFASTSDVDAIANAAAAAAVPAGTVVSFAGDNAPNGWLLCDGATHPRTTYPALFAAIGTTYGTTSASDFRVPDLRGRVAIGPDASAGRLPGSWNDSVGGSGGEGEHTLTIAEMPSHTHEQARNDDSTNDGCAAGLGSVCRPGATTSATGGNQPHNIVQPSLVLHYIIKL